MSDKLKTTKANIFKEERGVIQDLGAGTAHLVRIKSGRQRLAFISPRFLKLDNSQNMHKLLD